MPRGTASSSRVNSPSPPAQPMTKRDKRRNNIIDRLTDVTHLWNKEQPAHFRAQLQALQVDMTLVLRADAYDNKPLDDSAEAIDELVETVAAGIGPLAANARDDFLAMAGKRYYQYCQQTNMALEQRDADLVALKNRHDSATKRLRRDAAQRIAVASAEHRELAQTIRRRLINSVTRKRDRLVKEKEQLNIADANALTFAPNHFTINIPASPGGVHANRKTRNTRQKPIDDPEASLERGRKRKAPDDHEPADSPGPPLLRPSATESLDKLQPSDVRSSEHYSQYDAPVYSIEQLFTEKELALASSTAQMAAREILLREQLSALTSSTSTGTGNGTEVNSHDKTARAIASGAATATGGDATTGSEAAATDNASTNAEAPAANAESPPTASKLLVEMERTQSYHVTRGAAKANPLAFLSEAAAAVDSDPVIFSNPFIPNIIPITKTDRGAPTPPAMNALDVEGDIAMMFPQGHSPATTGTAPSAAVAHASASETTATASSTMASHLTSIRNRFLEQACLEPAVSQPFRLPLNEAGPAAIRGGVSRPSYLGFADPSSMTSDLRTESMVRTASSTGGMAAAAAAAAAAAVGPTTATAGIGAALAGPSGGALASILAADAQGTSMSRTTSAAGSEMMARTASATGEAPLVADGTGMRRTRTRLI